MIIPFYALFSDYNTKIKLNSIILQFFMEVIIFKYYFP